MSRRLPFVIAAKAVIQFFSCFLHSDSPPSFVGIGWNDDCEFRRRLTKLDIKDYRRSYAKGGGN